MFNKCVLAVLVVGCIATVLHAQPEDMLDWQTLTHKSHLSKKTLLADARIAIQGKIPLLDMVEGTVYLYCKESGALLDAVPIKDAYLVMIFPVPNAKRFNFAVYDSDSLLKEGIDVKLLRQVLRMNTENGMSGPNTPFTLDVRFTVSSGHEVGQNSGAS